MSSSASRNEHLTGQGCNACLRAPHGGNAAHGLFTKPSTRPMHSHEFYMRIALSEALKAYEIGEVPVGAVVVSSEGNVLSKAHNETMRQNDPSAHAEIIALREAAEVLKNYRLNKTRIYVTIEPCVMCAGALIHARVEEVIFGVSDPKGGGLITLYQLGNDTRLNHQLKVTSGVLKAECGEIIQRFFKEKRTGIIVEDRSQKTE